MKILLATSDDLRQLIRQGGNAEQRREQNARLHDKSVGSIEEALDTIPTDGPAKDKTVGGIATAQQRLQIVDGASYRDTSVGGHRAAAKLIDSQDPLGERLLPQLWDTRARVRDLSSSSVTNAAKVIEAADGAALKDKTVGATQRAKKQLVAAAHELLQ